MNSEGTKQIYIYQLNKFMKFFNIKDYDELVNIEQKKIQIMKSGLAKVQ